MKEQQPTVRRANVCASFCGCSLHLILRILCWRGIFVSSRVFVAFVTVSSAACGQVACFPVTSYICDRVAVMTGGDEVFFDLLIEWFLLSFHRFCECLSC